MRPLTAVIPYSSSPYFQAMLLSLTNSGLTDRILILSPEPVRFKFRADTFRVLVSGPLGSRQTLSLIMDDVKTENLLLMTSPYDVSFESGGLDTLMKSAETTGAGLIYSDLYTRTDQGKTLCPLSDYLPGSVRDDFDFGGMILLSVPAIRKAYRNYGALPDLHAAALYELRLKLSIDHSIHHIPEPLYSVIAPKLPGFQAFSYLDPRNQAVQKEMESAFTDYLKKIGAYLSPQALRKSEPARGEFPFEASIIIPVRNRKETIADAVKSAVSQEAEFPFNVIVVDNHSIDGTTEILSTLSRQYPKLKPITPLKSDLGIGGCWNEALNDPSCGRYAVQLDSDDLYSSTRTLPGIVDLFRRGQYAMVIGSYTVVDSELKEIPPGLIDHREWSDDNGHNNALRVNGLGAPRAFETGLMRQMKFLNVSYGEDYAAALRISREYRIGRIYESLYYCRRWPGNTDANLSLQEKNRHDAFKDEIRGDEIEARKKINSK
jgi:hypothetical protein